MTDIYDELIADAHWKGADAESGAYSLHREGRDVRVYEWVDNRPVLVADRVMAPFDPEWIVAKDGDRWHRQGAGGYYRNADSDDVNLTREQIERTYGISEEYGR